MCQTMNNYRMLNNVLKLCSYSVKFSQHSRGSIDCLPNKFLYINYWIHKSFSYHLKQCLSVFIFCFLNSEKLSFSFKLVNISDIQNKSLNYSYISALIVLNTIKWGFVNFFDCFILYFCWKYLKRFVKTIPTI